MRTSDLRVGTCLRYDSKTRGPCVIRLAFIMDNDLVRYFRGRCIYTGTEVTGGLYTEDDFSRIKAILTDAEVDALLASRKCPSCKGQTPHGCNLCNSGGLS